MLDRQRRRLFVALLGALLGLLAVLLVSAYGLVRYLLFAELEKRLGWMGYAVAFSVEDEGGVPDFAESVYLGEGAPPLDRHTCAQWVDLQGRVLRSSGGLVLAADLPLSVELQNQEAPEPARVFTILMKEDGKPAGYARVGLGTAPLRQELHRVLVALVLAGLGAGLGLAWAGHWWTARVLAPVAQAYQDLSLYAGAVAHELRTPLAAVKLSAETTLRHFEDLPPAELREALVEVEAATDDMIRLAENLILLSSLRHGRQQPQATLVALDQLASRGAARFEPAARERGIELCVQVPRGGPSVRAVERHLEMVLDNLLENALRYTPAGGRVEVTVTAAQLEVKDTGIGLSADEQARIFEPFWRSDQARARFSGGAGLGLAIVAALLRHQGGHISVHSTPGQGSRFVITL